MSQEVGGIVEELMDEPHVEGRRVSVRHIHERVEGRGLEPGTVADRLELDVADVYRALAYYHDHPTEMAAARQRREQSFDEHRDGAVTGPEDV